MAYYPSNMMEIYMPVMSPSALVEDVKIETDEPMKENGKVLLAGM